MEKRNKNLLNELNELETRHSKVTQRTKKDPILAEINVPVMNGLKLVSLVRGDPNYKDISIIMITTEGFEEDRKRALAIGATAYLPKPIQTQELIKLVNGFISR